MANSRLEVTACNPNSKKSRILVVESRIISEPNPRTRDKELRREMDELESIERKTQDLVVKEK